MMCRSGKVSGIKIVLLVPFGDGDRLGYIGTKNVREATRQNKKDGGELGMRCWTDRELRNR